MKGAIAIAVSAICLSALSACTAPANPGVPGSSEVQRPDIPGTVFTIVFENENIEQILDVLPTFSQLAAENSQAAAYTSHTHPSLPNYIELTSGSTRGITHNNDPRTNVQIGGNDNLADQLDAANVPWRAYFESMGKPCNFDSVYPYSAHHNPFLYYTTMASDPVRCEQSNVDFDAHFTQDLASNNYRFMFIVPNLCNDLHDCDGMVGDAWLHKVAAQIMASPGYQNGGALFILFDEGNTRYMKAGANLATIVASPNLVDSGYISETGFNHKSWLATIQDIFRMPRLSTTKDAVPMAEHFRALHETAPN